MTVTLYFIIAACIAFPLNTAMLFSDVQSIGSTYDAEHDRSSDAGISVLLGLFFSSFWPVGMIIVFCVTGFAQHGIMGRRL